MLVRSLCNHYHNTYRKEDEEFDHTGPLYEHIVPAMPPEPVELEQPKKRGKAADKQGAGE